MPNHITNHITNILTLVGSESDVKKVREAIAGVNVESEELISLDFNKIIPMPSSLSISSGSTTDFGLAVIMSREKGDHSQILKIMNYPWAKAEGLNTPEKMCQHLIDEDKANLTEGLLAFTNLKEYGHMDWYSWSIANWGTKWNAYSIESIDDISIKFQTAWSSPLLVIKTLSKQFPNVEMMIEYADEDFGYNCGRTVFKEGEEITSEQPEGGSVEAYLLAIEIDGMNVDEFLDRFGDFDDDNIIEIATKAFSANEIVEASIEHNYVSEGFLQKLKNTLIDLEKYELIKSIDDKLESLKEEEN